MAEALGGFVGTARVLFRSRLGASTTSELFSVGLDAAGGYGLSNRIATDLPRLLEAAPPGHFFTADPNGWQPVPKRREVAGVSVLRGPPGVGGIATVPAQPERLARRFLRQGDFSAFVPFPVAFSPVLHVRKELLRPGPLRRGTGHRREVRFV